MDTLEKCMGPSLGVLRKTAVSGLRNGWGTPHLFLFLSSQLTISGMHTRRQPLLLRNTPA
jgi:hypothetical protein